MKINSSASPQAAEVPGASARPKEQMIMNTKNRPPRTADQIQSSLGSAFAHRNGVAAYVREYRNGFAAGSRSTISDDTKWNSGQSSDAWDDGYLDAAAGRERWHLTYCPTHDTTC